MRNDGLIRQAAAGDPAAFEQLVLLHQTQVYSLCLRLCGNPDDAYDLSQEAFLRAWRCLDQYQFEAEFSTWLYRLTRNICIDFLRKQKRQKTISLQFREEDGEAELPIPDCAPLPEEQAQANEVRRALAAAIQKLPEDQREILVLRVVNDLPYEQIAEILDIKLGTVKSRLARARIQLKKILEAGNPGLFDSSNDCVQENGAQKEVGPQ